MKKIIITCMIFTSFIIPSFAKDIDIDQLFSDRLSAALKHRIPRVMMENTSQESALMFIKFELIKGFGVATETRKLDKEEEILLSKINFSWPESENLVNCDANKIVISDLINEICRQLNLNLVILTDGSFYFISNKIMLDMGKYLQAESIFRERS